MNWFLKFSYVICCFICVTNGFATKELYARIGKFIGVVDFGDTKFHDTQTITAICITQYRYLVRNKINLPLPPEPKYYDQCPYTQMFKGDINAEKIAKQAMWNLVDAVTDPDSCLFQFSPFKKVTDPTYHYDAEEKLPETNKRVIQRRINAYKEALKWGGENDWSYETIVQLLGNNIHSLQDFYSHTNWIEMGKTDININVGLNGDLGVPILSPNETSCSTCSIKDMSPAERKIYDDFVENPISQILFGFIPCLKGSTEYAFPCQNNVATNGLTSGYYESEKDIAPKPPSGNKCSHGGGFDESVTIAATGGISKDADNMFFAPHYKLHQKAAKLAVEATLQYFEDFRLSIKDEKKFGQLIGIQKTPSIGIAIVLDTTESMKTQWNDVITQVLDDIDEVTKKNPSKTINYFLMPFNDPDFGFPSEDKGVFATNDLTQFSQKLSSLKPKGGGDIPEMCLPAILSTLKKVGTGVSINVYTDSISKKPELLQQIGAIAVGKNVKVSFTMFGENLPNSINHKKSLSSVLGLRHSHEIFQDYQKINVDEEDSNSNETEAYSTLQDYVNLATLTEGFYEKYRKIYGAKQRFSATNNISRNDWEIIDSVYINDITAFSYSFIVDDTMNYIEIEMDLLFGGETIKNLNVNISSPTTLLPLNENFTTDMVRKFVYNNPTPGNWTMNINNIDVTQYILLKVSSPSYLDVHIRLIPSLNSSTQHLRAPIIGEGKYDIFVECASCKTMESLIVTPCGNETRYHQSAPVYVTSFNWWYIENVIFPAAGGLICFEINGTTLRGNRFTRLIDKKISLISVGIKGSVSKPEIFNHQNASLSFYITNYGASDSFNLTIITNKNINLSFNQKIYTINSKATINDTIEISITDPYVFSINLELTVTAQSTPSMTAQQNYFISILDSDDDIDAPVCNILTDGNSTCPFDSCVDQKYDAEVEFYDSGTGVFRINAEEGEWNIQKFDKGTTAKLNASGKLDCCTEISRFFVFDKNGLIGRCLFKNNVKGKPSTTSTTITPTTTTSNSPVSNILLIFLPICNLIFSFLGSL